MIRNKNAVAVLILLVALAAGCATTPDSVKLATVMQAQTIQTVQDNTFLVLKAYNSEAKALSVTRYAIEFERAEEALMDENGKVDLEQYKAVASAFAKEIETSNAYYDEQLNKFQSTLLYQFMTAGRLSEVIQAYQETSGFTPEMAEEIIIGLSDIAKESIEIVQQRRAEAAEAAGVAGANDIEIKPPSWEQLLQVIRGRIAAQE